MKAVYNDRRMIVYLVENKRNGKRYVGLTKHDLETRWGQHVKDALYERSNMPLHRAIRKYGADEFFRTVIDTGESEEQLRELEKSWIEALGTYESGYNATRGGDGLLGYTHSEETKKCMSEARKGEKNHNFGKRFGFSKTGWSDEAKEKLSEKRKGEGNPFKGKHHTEEARKKIGEATTLNKSKPIVQVDKVTAVEVARYVSAKEASEKTGITYNKIAECARGLRKSHRGFRWIYVEDYKTFKLVSER